MLYCSSENTTRSQCVRTLPPNFPGATAIIANAAKRKLWYGRGKTPADFINEYSNLRHHLRNGNDTSDPPKMTHISNSVITLPENENDPAFGFSTKYEKYEEPRNEPFVADRREYVCGLGAAFINIAVTYPINKLIFRQMLHGVGVTSAAGQLSSEGFHYLYRGIIPPLCQKSFSLSIMFGVYEECRRPLENVKVPHYLAKAIAAMVAGTVEATLAPFERVQTLLQHQQYHTRFRNTYHAFKCIGQKHGFLEYYRGLVPILLRNGPSNVMFFFMRDEAKELLPTHGTWWGQASQEFVSGAVIGAIISTVFYPLNVMKVHMQSTVGGQFQSFTSCFIELYKTRGLRNMYRGVHMNYTRSFISWGVINAGYEFFKKHLN